MPNSSRNMNFLDNMEEAEQPLKVIRKKSSRNFMKVRSN